MKRSADVVVLGLGAHGGAALYQLAKRGMDVIGIDQFPPGHAHGSSNGESRITRLAIGEGVVYTPFALRSHEIWPELEELLRLKEKLYLKTGGLMIGVVDGASSFHGKRDFVGTAIRVARQYDIRHRLLSAGDMRMEFPLFHVADDEIGYYEYDAGVLFPERCVQANHDAADYFGATRLIGVKVFDLRQEGDSVVLSTSEGKITAGQCVVSAGAWVRMFLPEAYRRYFRILRQVLYWFRPRTDEEKFRVGQFPIYIWEREGIYGFPDLGSGFIKVAPGDQGRETDPEDVDRSVSAEEFHEMETVLKRTIPSLPGSAVKAVTCLYTQTDGDFVIDWHPEMGNVLVLSPCCGHGFKHSAAVGELAAKLIFKESHGYDLSRFSIKRFFYERFA